jgi:spore coat protein CotH
MSIRPRYQSMPIRRLWLVTIAATIPFSQTGCGAEAEKPDETNYLFGERAVPRLSIEIPPEGMEVLRTYRQVFKQKRPERIDVKATVREGDQVYKDVAIHLKGSFTFQPIDGRPSLTLNFDKFTSGQRFHGLTKLHLNNTVQDPSYLNEAVSRDFFNDIGVPTPRAGHALVTLNGRSLGLYVLLEGANKTFLKRHFQSAKGNLYDAENSVEIGPEIELDSGDKDSDRAELMALVEAASEIDPAKRWARMNELLDVDEFLSFIAGEVLFVHWDGYATGAPNNYRVYHDVSRNKIVFMPHGMDQLLGSGAAARTLRPSFTGIVARGLMSTPEGRRRYMERVAHLAKNEFTQDALIARVNRIAAKLKKGLEASDPRLSAGFDSRVEYIRSNLIERCETVATLLSQPEPQPLKFDKSNIATLSNWRFKSSNTRPASGGKVVVDGAELLKVQARVGVESSGTWRSQALMDDGRYVLTVRARTEGFDPANATGINGLILRKSGDKNTPGIISSKWTTLRYEFQVGGIEDIEFVCEFSGTQGSALFDPASIRLTRLESEETTKEAAK